MAGRRGSARLHVYALATAAGGLYAGLGDGTLLRSEDGGESWSELGERIGALTALVPAAPATVAP